jgi:hypothetical protein
MDGLTVSQVFEIRELHRAGIWSGRISELLDVDEMLVRRALDAEAGPGDGDEMATEPVVEAPREEPVPRPNPPAAWAPPANSSTRWQERRLITGETVRLREVPLWGRLVLIDADWLVFCPCCWSMRTTDELGHPDNHCPVGIIWTGGPLPFDVDKDHSPVQPMYGRRVVDLMREPF